LSMFQGAPPGIGFPTSAEFCTLRAAQNLMPILRAGFTLSRVPTPLPAMSHTACRRAPGSVRRGDGAAPQSQYGSDDRWGTPRKVPVGSCR
jgi:hypothetical protein